MRGQVILVLSLEGRYRNVSDKIDITENVITLFIL